VRIDPRRRSRCRPRAQNRSGRTGCASVTPANGLLAVLTTFNNFAVGDSAPLSSGTCCTSRAGGIGLFFMHKPSFRDSLHAGRLLASLKFSALALVAVLESFTVTAGAQPNERRTDPAIRPEFREPVTLTSKEGVLEVRLTARQGQATLDTVAAPVQNFLLFDYEVIRGTASDGHRSGGNLYPAPTLQGVSRRNADRASRERPRRPDHPGLLQSAVHVQGSVRPDLPGADDLVTHKPPYSRGSYQSEGKCRQRVAAYPSRNVKHLSRISHKNSASRR
jgi:hypothetical protein